MTLKIQQIDNQVFQNRVYKDCDSQAVSNLMKRLRILDCELFFNDLKFGLTWRPDFLSYKFIPTAGTHLNFFYHVDKEKIELATWSSNSLWANKEKFIIGKYNESKSNK